MTQRQCQGIGGIGGLGQRIESEHTRDHGLHLTLVGGAVSRDGGLHLGGRVRRGGEPMLCRDQQGDTAGLRRAHDRVPVLLGEDALYRDDVRAVLLDDLPDSSGDLCESTLDREIGWGAQHPDVHEPRGAIGSHVDDADAAAGEAGVDPENAQSGCHPLTLCPYALSSASTDAVSLTMSCGG